MAFLAFDFRMGMPCLAARLPSYQARKQEVLMAIHTPLCGFLGTTHPIM